MLQGISMKARRRLSRPRSWHLPALPLALSACTSSTYMGIPLTTGQAAPELQQLASRARAGDKQAQLDLGIRFEEGWGVARDIKTARALYKLAANDSGGQIWVYVPGGSGSAGRVMQVGDAPFRVGLEDAKKRLEALGHED